MDIQNVVSALCSERVRLDRAIAALESLSRPDRRRGRPPKAQQATPTTTHKRGGITPAGRRRLSEMMKLRWAERTKATRKRKPMSAAARKRISAAMKERWGNMG